MDVLLDIVAETTKDCSISRQIESIHCKNLPSNKIAFFVDYVIHSIHKSQGTRRKRKQEKKKLTASNLTNFCCRAQGSQTLQCPRTR